MNLHDDQLPQRVARLESLVAEQHRVRRPAAALAAGITALFLSWALPWLRADTPVSRTDIFASPDRTTATGWDLVAWAFSSPAGARGTEITLLAVTPPLLALAAAALYFLIPVNALRLWTLTLSIMGALALSLLMLGWDNSRTTTASGLIAALAGCAAIIWATVRLRPPD